jgi:hypothetical protein
VWKETSGPSGRRQTTKERQWAFYWQFCFAVTKFLLIIAAVVLVLWLLGFVARGAEGARWYRW